MCQQVADIPLSMTKANNKKRDIFASPPIWCWGILFALGAFLLFWRNTQEDFWLDEGFTFAMMRHSLADIIAYTKYDNHSPLYYLSLKLCCLLFGENMFVMRGFSGLAILATAALGAGPIRRAAGGAGFAFAAIVLTTPICIAFGQEARMFAWAGFFVTGAAVYSCLAMASNRTSDWFKLAFFLAVCVHIHAYALIAGAWIGVVGLTWSLVSDRSKFTCWLLMGLAGVVSLGIWLPWLLQSIDRINNANWLTPVTLVRVIGGLIYPFMLRWDFVWWSIPIGVIAGGFSIWGLWRTGTRHKSESEKSLEGAAAFSLSWFCVTVVACVFTSVYLYSVLKEPLYEFRYLMAITGLLLLPVAIGVSRLPGRWGAWVAIALLAAMNSPTLYLHYNQRHYPPGREVAAFIEERFQPGDRLLHFRGETMGILIPVMPDRTHYFYAAAGEKQTAWLKALEPIMQADPELPPLVDPASRVWFLYEQGYRNEPPAPSVRRYLKSKPIIERDFSLPHARTILSLELYETDR